MGSLPYLVMESSPGAPVMARCGEEVRISSAEGQHIGRGEEQVVAGSHADRLQRRAERAGAAEQDRRPEAVDRVPAGEDHQRDRHQALARRNALVPAARVVERQIGPADTGQRAAGGGREQADEVRVEADGAGGVGAVADDADHQADPG